jgi:hypothetical protein
MKTYPGTTYSGAVQFTVSEIDPSKDRLIVWSHQTRKRETLSLDHFQRVLRDTTDVVELPVAPYGGVPAA